MQFTRQQLIGVVCGALGGAATGFVYIFAGNALTGAGFGSAFEFALVPGIFITLGLLGLRSLFAGKAGRLPTPIVRLSALFLRQNNNTSSAANFLIVALLCVLFCTLLLTLPLHWLVRPSYEGLEALGLGPSLTAMVFSFSLLGVVLGMVRSWQPICESLGDLDWAEGIVEAFLMIPALMLIVPATLLLSGVGG